MAPSDAFFWTATATGISPNQNMDVTSGREHQRRRRRHPDQRALRALNNRTTNDHTIIPTFLRPVATVILVTRRSPAGRARGRYTYTATSTTVLDQQDQAHWQERSGRPTSIG